jgi:Domain of unknown function (DUF4440)
MLDIRRVFIVGLVGCSLLTVGVAGPEARGQAAETRKLSSAEQSVLDAESMRFQAQLQGDAAALDRAIADEATYTHSSGMMQTKAEYLHGVQSGAVHYRSLEPSQRVVRVYGNVGVTHGIIAMDTGGDRQNVARYTGVYIERDGRWQLLAWHTTTIAPPK